MGSRSDVPGKGAEPQRRWLRLWPPGKGQQERATLAREEESGSAENPDGLSRLDVEVSRSTREALAEVAKIEGVRIDIVVNQALAEFLDRRRPAVAERALPTNPLSEVGEPPATGVYLLSPPSVLHKAEHRPFRGKYGELFRYFATLPHDRNLIELTFQQIEEILEDQLPLSARAHRPWWANATGGQMPARAWLEAGWEVDSVDLEAESVRFRRHFRDQWRPAESRQGRESPEDNVPADSAASNAGFSSLLDQILHEAQRRRLPYVDIEAGELHRKVGGYPGKHHRMPVVCGVMRSRMRDEDTILQAPPKGNGASLKIRYRLPRR